MFCCRERISEGFVTVALAAAAFLSFSACGPDPLRTVYEDGKQEEKRGSGGEDVPVPGPVTRSLDYSLEAAGVSADSLVVSVVLTQGESGVYDLRLTPWTEGCENVSSTVRLYLEAGGPAARAAVCLKGFPAGSGTLICALGDVSGGEVVVRTLPFAWEPEEEPDPVVTLTSLSFPFTCIGLETGEEKTVSVVPSPEGAPVGEIVWSSEPEGIVEIQSEGLSAALRGLAGGEARLCASCAGISAEMTVTVREPEVPFSASLSAAEVYEGDAVRLTVETLRDAGAGEYEVCVLADGQALPLIGNDVPLETLSCGSHVIEFKVTRQGRTVLEQSFPLEIYRRPAVRDFYVNYMKLWFWQRTDAVFVHPGLEWSVGFHVDGDYDTLEADWSECEDLLSAVPDPDNVRGFLVTVQGLGRSRMRLRYGKGAASGVTPDIPVVCFDVLYARAVYSFSGWDAGSVRLGFAFLESPVGNLTVDLKTVSPTYEVCFSDSDRRVSEGTVQHPGKVTAGRGDSSVITWSAGGDADALLGSVGGLFGMRDVRWLKVTLDVQASLSSPYVIPVGVHTDFSEISGSIWGNFTLEGSDPLLEEFAPWYLEEYGNY